MASPTKPGLLGRLRASQQRLIERLPLVTPRTRAFRLVRGVLFALSLGIGGLLGLDLYSGLGAPTDISIGMLFGALVFAALYGAVQVFLLFLQKFSPRWLALLVAGFVLFFAVWGLSPASVWMLALGFLQLVVLGLLSADLMWERWRVLYPIQRGLLSAMLLACMAGLVALVFFVSGGWQRSPGLPPAEARGPAQLAVDDPFLPGPFEVLTLSYGSGTDQRRPAYGTKADLITQPVDASHYASLKDLPASTREWYWGFGLKDLPLNAQVWYPDGDGPFPLVLIVHGNHDMHLWSEGGYAYLGELLASRGYIFVSVDENFFNGYFSGGMSGENDARAWLLLEHLALWRNWNADPALPFAGKVDLANIALIGHSRGGEAAAIAAAFNELSHYPDNALLSWNYHFAIRSVIALAPSDQQYTPADQPVSLTDINYLVLQGSSDADVSTFSGLRQYQRVRFSGAHPELFKAAVYIYGANHGQFNTDWGRYDLGLPRRLLLNTDDLLDGGSQRQAAKVLITAFLDATLKGDRAVQPLFTDLSLAGDWLPDTYYISQYQGVVLNPLANYEEDIDVTTGSVPGIIINSRGLSRWREEELDFRSGREQENHAVRLDWHSSTAWYALDLTLPHTWSEKDVLSFNLGDAREEPEAEWLTLSITLEDADGQQASLPLSAFGPLLPQFPARFTNWPVWEDRSYAEPSEPILQTYRFPLSAFQAANPALDLGAIIKVRFNFDQGIRGAVYLDEIGIEQPGIK